jgi:hypothetical protein
MTYEPTVLMDGRLNGPQRRSGHCSGRTEIPSPFWESNPGRPARGLVTVIEVISLVAQVLNLHNILHDSGVDPILFTARDDENVNK